MLVLCVLVSFQVRRRHLPLFPPSRPPFRTVLVGREDRDGDEGEERSEKKRVPGLVARDCRGRKRRRETQELTMTGAVEDGKPARPPPPLLPPKNHSLGIVQTREGPVCGGARPGKVRWGFTAGKLWLTGGRSRVTAAVCELVLPVRTFSNNNSRSCFGSEVPRFLQSRESSRGKPGDQLQDGSFTPKWKREKGSSRRRQWFPALHIHSGDCGGSGGGIGQQTWRRSSQGPRLPDDKLTRSKREIETPKGPPLDSSKQPTSNVQAPT